jgi:putative ABC transport system permease protein
VNSLQHNIQTELKDFGKNTIYVDKWDYAAGNGPEYPWWKFVKRPAPKFDEIKQIKERTPSAKYVAFNINANDNVEYKDNSLSGVNLYGNSEDFQNIYTVDIVSGRYITESEFDHGSPVIVIGNEVAEKLFVSPEVAIGKLLQVRGKKLEVIGIIKKQGKSMIGGWQFDQSVIMPYKFARNIMWAQNSSPLILVQAKDNLQIVALKDDLKGTMRAIHKLSPTQDDDFALNDINEFSDAVSAAFVPLNIGGWIIAGISLLVGMFGVANIMFVTVRERTGQIGLKKAVGAKNRVILTEFLLESAFLCIIGGLMGLILVFVLTKILSGALNFPVFISSSNLVTAISICIIVGVLAGIIPASQAARMDPVVAIRSK